MYVDNEQIFEFPELKKTNNKTWLIEPWINYTQVFPK